MLEIKYIRENVDAVKKAVKDKNVDIDIDELLQIDRKRRELLQQVESLNTNKKEIAKRVKDAPDAEKPQISAEGKQIKEKLSEFEPKMKEAEERFKALMLRVPNVPSEDTPVGKDENDNVEVAKWGEPKKFDFEAKDHVELGTSMNLLDTERGVKVAGFRGYFLKNELAMMHLGLMMVALQRLQAKGFEPMISPTMVRDMPLYGSGHFPGEAQEIYELTDHSGEGKHEDKYLVGTSEPSLLGYHADEILDLKDLPRTMTALSPCYRKEIGGYGKDTRGLYRVHEFLKVEQVVLCEAKVTEGLDWLEKLRQNSEELLQDLELPYRVLQMCTGDMGTGKYKMYDIETWMPSREAYGETHSVSYLTDWQARRIGLRYKDTDGETKHCHTLNNTMVASPRILIAILENYQQADGSVAIPKILQPFMGKQKVIKPIQ